MPTPETNHSFPSAAFATGGLKYAGDTGLSVTPSAAPQSFVLTLRVGSAIHATRSSRMTRTRPQAVYSHSDRSLSSIDQWIALHGRPLRMVSVLIRPLAIRLRPPSSVAAHIAPSRSSRRPETWPLPSPS